MGKDSFKKSPLNLSGDFLPVSFDIDLVLLYSAVGGKSAVNGYDNAVYEA